MWMNCKHSKGMLYYKSNSNKKEQSMEQASWKFFDLPYERYDVDTYMQDASAALDAMSLGHLSRHISPLRLNSWCCIFAHLFDSS